MVLCYLVIGSAVQYFVKGERGIRILPHYDFWRGAFVLIMVSPAFDVPNS